jgi:hypothetical protein
MKYNLKWNDPAKKVFVIRRHCLAFLLIFIYGIFLATTFIFPVKLYLLFEINHGLIIVNHRSAFLPYMRARVYP